MPYIFENDIRSSKTWVVAVGYNFFVFDIHNQQNLTAAQPIKVEVQ